MDFVGIWRVKLGRGSAETEIRSCQDFEILVPIYGSLDYLENVSYLKPYGSRVVLCTTNAESEDFYRGIRALMDEHGFRCFVGSIVRQASQGKRATGGTVRDRLVRDALAEVTAPYVVCVDADTTTARPLDELVGEVEFKGLDLASIRLVPSNPVTLLARMQVHEYRIAMDLRQILPWLVSGACHVAATPALREVMGRHSLFFQGNDVETGLLAEALGYRVGHVPFDVSTSVPERFVPWWRQRLAWAGGGVRLFVANPQFMLRHPFVWTYGLIFGLAMFPLRWASVGPAGPGLLVVIALYVLLCFGLYRGRWDVALFTMPLFSLVTSLVLVPLGLFWYVKMAWADKNPGFIRPSREFVCEPHATPNGSRRS